MVTPAASSSARRRAWKAASAAASMAWESTPATRLLGGEGDADPPPGPGGQTDDVGQIVFALGVVVPHLTQQVEQQRRRATRTPALQAVIANSSAVASLASTIRDSAPSSPITSRP